MKNKMPLRLTYPVEKASVHTQIMMGGFKRENDKSDTKNLPTTPDAGNAKGESAEAIPSGNAASPTS